MPHAAQFPRLAEKSLADALADTPVVVVQGPRQCGKTTLALRVGRPLGFEYLNLDDGASRRAAQDDPAGFVARLPERVIIDEVQRAPELFLPLKVEVDRRRVPGR
ncbi:AAA family ATPase, partial [Gemmatimonas sp.]|uniref:AAA family ATPase n=1 Tax=Gemmatimonas sp. TaxID=1962908 RepID=UPI00333FD17A